MDMNMDVKDLIAKLKKGGGSGSKTKKSGGMLAFFDKNPKMKILIPVIMIVISVAVALVIIVTTEKNTVGEMPADGPAGDKVNVLPEDVRNLEEIEIEGKDVFDEVDVSHAKITLIMHNSDGYYTATMETDTQSFPHLQVGDYIGGSSWMVESINETEVIIALGEKQVTLKADF